MKKFMKALALTLALCMVLSVSAFAELGKTDDATAANPTTHVVDFTVTGVQTGEQVALLILTQGTELSAADENTILYIDQTAATADGASFEATIKDGVTSVDVYVGSSTINENTTVNDGGAWKVYANLPVANTSSVTISSTAAKILNIGDPGKDGATITRPGAAIGIQPKNVNLTKMKWVLKNADTSAADPYMFSKTIDISIDESVDGEVWFTGVFTSAGKLDGFKIGEVAAIFLAADGTTEYYVGTDVDTMKPYKKTQ